MSRIGNRLTKWAGIGLVCLLFAAAGAVKHYLIPAVERRNDEEPGAWKNAPPAVAVTAVVLGAFRGLAVDLLWLRLSELQDRGKYLEIAQLAGWITKLEPHCSDIWAFHAWNMAYNISVMLSNHEDRWRWVKSGIDLLCQDGIRYNPDDADLHAEIGWMFQYKIGAFADKAHETYKRRLASDMTRLVGGARPDYSAILANPQRIEALKREYALDPTLMQKLDQEAGPFDWRLPETLAVYWAWKGLAHAGGRSLASCHRIIYQSMHVMFMRGSLRFEPSTGRCETGPDLAKYPRVIEAFENAIKACPGDQNILTAFSIFLDRAIILQAGEGRLAEAADALQRLRKLRPDITENDPLAYAETEASRLRQQHSGLLPGLDKPLK